jgi:parvulin-like peptidyl-prolyl isomerase
LLLKGIQLLAKKQKKPELKRLPTKQQLSKWERQRKMQHIILITGCVFFAVIIAIVGYGYYDVQVKPFQQKVLRVNDTVIDMNYYLEWLALFLRGTEPAQAPLMAEMITGTIIQNELLLQRAPKMGVTIKDSDIEDELAKQKLPNTRIYREVYSSKSLSDKMFVYFDSKVPTTAKQVNVQAMFLESEVIANEVAAKINAGESIIKLAKEFSVEEFTKEKSGELGWLMDGLTGLAGGKFSNSMLDDIAFSTSPGTLSKATFDSSVVKPLGYWILKVTEKDKDQNNHVFGILLGTRSEADEIRAKLSGGSDFAGLAKEKSQHLESKDSGGDLGFVKRGQSIDAIINAASQLSSGVLSEPILDTTARTRGGYWLVKVLERDENRQITLEMRDQLKSTAFQNWLQDEEKTSTIEKYLDEAQKLWAVDHTIKKLGLSKKK